MTIGTFRSGLTNRALVLVAGLLVASGIAAQSPPPAKAAPAKKTAPAKKMVAPEFKMVLEPRAIDLLKAMSAKLAAAKSMSFTATVGYEYPSKLGPPIVYTSRYDVTMQRPNKLKVIMPGDGPASEFYYDGKTMMAFAPAENLVAVADAPPTIEAALKVAFDTAAIFYPFTDLLVTDRMRRLPTVRSWPFISGRRARWADRRPTCWAGRTRMSSCRSGSAPMTAPRRIRATYAADPMQLRHEMELTNWQLDGTIAAEAFASAKAQAAGRIAFKSPTAPPPGVKPLVGSKAVPSAPAKTPSKSQ